MQAQTRHITPGIQFNALIPRSFGQDTVIKGSGTAALSDTLQLMQQVIAETLKDTVLLAQKLKGSSVTRTCKNIWHFVYNHIQYKMDKRGVEQVRRPSRTWADRTTGVDCDCYTVFIGSILSNLGIPYLIRITKYGGRSHFQHVYPVVLHKQKEIIMDCVTDQFNHEVLYSEKKDITIPKTLFQTSGLNGVDTLDIALNALEQPRIPLHQVITPPMFFPSQGGCSIPKQVHPRTKTGKVVSPFRLNRKGSMAKMQSLDQDLGLLDLFLVTTISIAAGAGIMRLFKHQKIKSKSKTRKAKKA